MAFEPSCPTDAVAPEHTSSLWMCVRETLTYMYAEEVGDEQMKRQRAEKKETKGRKSPWWEWQERKRGKDSKISDCVSRLNGMGATWERGKSQDLSKI